MSVMVKEICAGKQKLHKHINQKQTERKRGREREGKYKKKERKERKRTTEKDAPFDKNVQGLLPLAYFWN